MKYVFMHVPKCAGTTIHNFFLANVRNARPCPERFNGFHSLSDDDINQYNIFSAHTDYAGVNRIPAPKLTITTLREPRERIVSLYNLWRSHDLAYAFRNKLHGPLAAHSLDFLSFLRHDRDGIQANIKNALVRNFLGHSWSDDKGSLLVDDASALEIALRNLASFDVIGLAENLSPFFTRLSAILGVEPPTVIPRDNSSMGKKLGEMLRDREVQTALEELTSLDQQFYRGAVRIVLARGDGVHTSRGFL